MLRLRHVPLVTQAVARGLGRWVLGTKAGRRVGGGVAAVAVVGSLWGGGSATHPGTWKGFSNEYAPTTGTLTIMGAPGKSATCTLRGKTGAAAGNGWVFRGNATVEGTSCEGQLGKNGSVKAVLKLRQEWRGRVKGIGGDWDDVSGSSSCEGTLEGTLAKGGAWKGTCKSEDAVWATSFAWAPDPG